MIPFNAFKITTSRNYNGSPDPKISSMLHHKVIAILRSGISEHLIMSVSQSIKIPMIPKLKILNSINKIKMTLPFSSMIIASVFSIGGTYKNKNVNMTIVKIYPYFLYPATITSR